jgi:hypothetical protein
MIDPVTGEIIDQKELAEHLGHEHGEVPIAENLRHGTGSKTVLTSDRGATVCATPRSTSSWASPRTGNGGSWGSGPETALQGARSWLQVFSSAEEPWRGGRAHCGL